MTLAILAQYVRVGILWSLQGQCCGALRSRCMVTLHEDGRSMSWYTLVFLTLAFAAVTFAAIMSHIPRVPEQRGLLGVIVVSAFTAVWTLLVTLVADPARGIEVSRGLFDLLV